MLNFLSSAVSLGFVVKFDELLPVLATTLIFVFIGLIIFAIAYFVIVMVSPFSVKKEIEDDQNIALAIIIGAIIIGVALIISAAIQGDSPTSGSGGGAAVTQTK